MDDGQCSVCSKNGSLRCGKCKVQYYCSRECQVKDWKIHKKVCADVRETKIFREAFYDKKPDPLNETVQELKALSVIPTTQRHSIPKYHFEYKSKYPRDDAYYRKLRNMWITFTSLTETRIKEDMDEYIADEATLDRRWGAASQFKELRMFLASNPQPGDIFANKPVVPYGNYFNKKIYDTMKNSPTPPQTFELGEKYVAVGFVDMFPLLVGTFIPNTKDPSTKEPMHYFGYDRCEIVVAKNLILFYMMAGDMPLDSILQIWFSTGWSEETLSKFQMVCRVMLSNEKVIPLHVPRGSPWGRIRALIQHWNDTTMSMKSVQILWAQHNKQSMHALLNLRYEVDRVEYARYLATGHLFGKSDRDYKYGNVTMFSLPDGYEDYKLVEENFFNTIAVDSLEYEKSIMFSVTKKLKAGLRTVMDLISKRSLLCFFLPYCICHGEDPEFCIKDIRNMNPKRIDWSNVADYTNLDGFFQTAKLCSGPDTVHDLHFTNWIFYVFGAALLDYPKKFEMYRKLAAQRHKEYERVKDRRPFLRQDEYIEWHLNAAEAALAMKYRQNFIDFVFNGREVDITEPIHERFNPFQKSEFIFFMSFTFRK